MPAGPPATTVDDQTPALWGGTDEPLVMARSGGGVGEARVVTEIPLVTRTGVAWTCATCPWPSCGADPTDRRPAATATTYSPSWSRRRSPQKPHAVPVTKPPTPLRSRQSGRHHLLEQRPRPRRDQPFHERHASKSRTRTRRSPITSREPDRGDSDGRGRLPTSGTSHDPRSGRSTMSRRRNRFRDCRPSHRFDHGSRSHCGGP